MGITCTRIENYSKPSQNMLKGTPTGGNIFEIPQVTEF
jgi:hypothetical protein